MRSVNVKDHEKLIAFAFLLGAIIALVFLASTFDRGAANDVVIQGKLRIIDSSVTGLLAVLGMAAQALFRIGTNEKVEISNSPTNPVPTTDSPAAVTPIATGELPEEEKIA